MPLRTEAILDQILVPRPNGSEALERVAGTLAALLERQGAAVELHAFTATPYGFRLCWSAALLLMLGYLALTAARRHGAALAVALVVPALLLLEFELLYSPVSGLLPKLEHNVVGSYAGRPGGPLLVFTAHYDTTTHFGDHRSWGPWGWGLGPAVGAAIALALFNLLRRRGPLARPLALAVAGVALVPFVAMAWFHAAGPLLRAPSPARSTTAARSRRCCGWPSAWRRDRRARRRACAWCSSRRRRSARSAPGPTRRRSTASARSPS